MRLSGGLSCRRSLCLGIGSTSSRRGSSSSTRGRRWIRWCPRRGGERLRLTAKAHDGGGCDFGRWGSAEFHSRPPGHGKQGCWHLYFEESGHGFTRSRSNEKIIDDENFWPSDSRVDGKYSRNGRENQGSFREKDWKCHSRENGVSPNGPGKPLDVSDKRSVDGIITVNSHPHSDFVNTWDHDKSGGVNGLGTGQRFESENSLGSIDWKLARSESMCSLGSGLSNSSSSKSMGVDSSEARAEAQMGNVTPVQSPSGDVAGATSAVAPSEETSAKKKARLGWGEGLAKYEKKKVDGPDDIATNNEAGYCGRTELLQLQVSNLAGTSPRIGGFSDCASPATPSSVALELLTRIPRMSRLILASFMRSRRTKPPHIEDVIYLKIKKWVIAFMNSVMTLLLFRIALVYCFCNGLFSNSTCFSQLIQLDPDPIVASFSCGAMGVISSLMILGANNNIEQQ